MDLFDEICRQKGILIQKQIGQLNLKKLIIEGIANFSHISYFAVDLCALKNSEDEVIEAFTAFQSMYNARIIFLDFLHTPNEKLFPKLLTAGNYNIVTKDENVEQAINECMSELGRQYKTALRQTNNEMRIDDNTIKVGICGSQSRVGTTTQSILLVKALELYGEMLAM